MTTKKPSPVAASAVADQSNDIDTGDDRFSPQYLLNLLLNVGSLLATVYDRRSPLTRNQTRLISSLLERDGQTQTELAHALEIHKVSIGIYISELEAMDLVERRQHPTDRRAKCIYLTPRLHAAKHIGRNQYAAIHHVATQGVDGDTYLSMLDCMELMRENLTDLDRKDRENGIGK
ncbi:MAG: MarR family transcriptional regulator [Parvibaculum sp.]